VGALAAACVLALGGLVIYGGAFVGGSSGGRTLDYWIAAVPVVWNIAPNGHDAMAMAPGARMDMEAMMGMALPTAQTVVRTVVYRRYSSGWKRPLSNAPRSSADGLLIPGPLIRARVGDHLRIHFKNMDTLRRQAHSMHFHGVHYAPTSDGAYVPGFSGLDADVLPGHTYTYVLSAGPDSAGVWPYHDHSTSMGPSIEGGMYGMLSILGRHERAPDREFEVVFAPWGKFMTIDGRAFLGNTPVFRAKVGQLVQWDVMAMGSDFHTFHVHGHRWITAGDVPRDTQTVGPAESFRVRWREDAPGTWLYHCHVEDHMMHGMIGIYRVSK
jgi:manganese oxidase